MKPIAVAAMIVLEVASTIDNAWSALLPQLGFSAIFIVLWLRDSAARAKDMKQMREAYEALVERVLDHAEEQRKLDAQRPQCPLLSKN